MQITSFARTPPGAPDAALPSPRDGEGTGEGFLAMMTEAVDGVAGATAPADGEGLIDGAADISGPMAVWWPVVVPLGRSVTASESVAPVVVAGPVPDDVAAQRSTDANWGGVPANEGSFGSPPVAALPERHATGPDWPPTLTRAPVSGPGAGLLTPGQTLSPARATDIPQKLVAVEGSWPNGPTTAAAQADARATATATPESAAALADTKGPLPRASDIPVTAEEGAGAATVRHVAGHLAPPRPPAGLPFAATSPAVPFPTPGPLAGADRQGPADAPAAVMAPAPSVDTAVASGPRTGTGTAILPPSDSDLTSIGPSAPVLGATLAVVTDAAPGSAPDFQDVQAEDWVAPRRQVTDVAPSVRVEPALGQGAELLSGDAVQITSPGAKVGLAEASFQPERGDPSRSAHSTARESASTGPRTAVAYPPVPPPWIRPPAAGLDSRLPAASFPLVFGKNEWTADVEDGVLTLASLSASPVADPRGPDGGRSLAATVAASVPRLVEAMAGAGVQRPQGGTEIALAPEELGKVRLQLQADAQHPDRMVVHLTFERPETLDLFRRHATELAEAMRAAGYAETRMEFGQSGTGFGPWQGPGGQADRAPDAIAAARPQDGHGAAPGQDPTRSGDRWQGTGGSLDLRL